MKNLRVFVLCALCVLWPHQGMCSYLGYPRLNFVGHIRADSDTRNNDLCNYRVDYPLNPNLNADWGFNGTNEFQFFESKITSVVLEDGTKSTNDRAVGCEIIQNIAEPFPKLTDLDVDVQDKSTIYGMKFGLNCNPTAPITKKDAAFYGKWTRSVIAQDMWVRIKCYSEKNHGSALYQDSFPFGAQGTTFVTDIDWNDLEGSTALTQLKNAIGSDGKLSVRITIFYYTRNYPPYIAYNATLGYVVGTIGVAQPQDTLNFGGSRLLSPNQEIPLGMSISKNDLCKDQDLGKYTSWMNNAPFEVDEVKREVRVDLSNSLPVNLYNTLRNLNQLQLGILTKLSSGQCVHLLGTESIPYLSEGWYSNTGGIYTFHLEDSELMMLGSSKLVVAQVVNSDVGNKPICGELPSTKGQHSAQILLEETPYFIRPKDYYVHRLEYGERATQTLYVTYFGQPSSGTNIQLVQNKDTQNRDTIPLHGVKPTQLTASTDSNGLVLFTFTVPEKIPYPREYNEPVCVPRTTTLPIDGQVYGFRYCLEEDTNCESTSVSPIAFLAFSTVEYTEPYDWVHDVKPILAQYAHLAPIMKTILDMSSFEDVTKTWNIHLLNLSMSMDFEAPGLMPTTRDLSPTKRDMILKWLTNPIYSKTEKMRPAGVPEKTECDPADAKSVRSLSNSYFKPPRCLLERIKFSEEPRVRDTYFGDIFRDDSKLAEFANGMSRQRPLYGLREARNAIRNKVKTDPNLAFYVDTCTKTTLQEQLQTAIQLEFATIPVYLTSLYSIKDGCNQEIYKLIRSVVMQEMLHVTQAANILIATGGRPIIDSAKAAPSYPTTGLPGGVLPKLTVFLSKLSLKHVYDVFMGIETPKMTLVGGIIVKLNTIGAFYEEITECIDYLDGIGQSPFDPTTVHKQVKWPWEADEDLGTVFIVKDSATAKQGIEEIATQGEGAGLLDPNDVSNNSLAHFFKFEEIVCQRRLRQVDEYHYAYSGAPIPFDPSGVWPMRNMHYEHSSEAIKPNSNCYTEARAFHQAYRALLRKMQEAFSSQPDQITEAVEIMETLQAHAKKLMWTRFRPNSIIDHRMCGPVWDYHWSDVEE